jgi:glutamate-1-semialdehyde 2,1-aminomutase
MILGHAFEPVVQAVIEKAKLGTSFGMPTELETQIAAMAVAMVPNIDKIRFVNSGTEACMSAVRLARGFTKRDKIIKFAGCYHGHSDSFLIQAANYNDLESVQLLVDANKDEIATIIVEPVAGNMGCIPPNKGFLEGLRQICTDNGILLIFDEVMTGFRLAAGGVQELLNVNADIICFGKVIGGGFYKQIM